MAEGGTGQKPGSRLAFKPAFYSTLLVPRICMNVGLTIPKTWLPAGLPWSASAVPKYLNSSSHPPQDQEPHTHVHSTIAGLFITLKCVLDIRGYQFLHSIWLKTFQNPHFQRPTFWMHHLSPQCWVFQGNKSYLGPSYEIA